MGRMPIHNEQARPSIGNTRCDCIEIMLNPLSSDFSCHVAFLGYSKTENCQHFCWSCAQKCPYLALSGFDQPAHPLKTSPLNIIVGLYMFPLAEMMGMRVAVSRTSLRKANWCSCFAEPICRVFVVFLSRKQHVSSIEKIQSSSMLYSLMVLSSNAIQWSTTAAFNAPP